MKRSFVALQREVAVLLPDHGGPRALCLGCNHFVEDHVWFDDSSHDQPEAAGPFVEACAVGACGCEQFAGRSDSH